MKVELRSLKYPKELKVRFTLSGNDLVQEFTYLDLAKTMAWVKKNAAMTAHEQEVTDMMIGVVKKASTEKRLWLSICCEQKRPKTKDLAVRQSDKIVGCKYKKFYTIEDI